MITIGILEPLAGDVIIDLIHQKIDTEIQEITKENFGEKHIPALETVFYYLFYIVIIFFHYTFYLNIINLF